MKKNSHIAILFILLALPVFVRGQWLDPTLNGQGYKVISLGNGWGFFRSLALQQNGRMLIAGTDSDGGVNGNFSSILRLLPDGSEDSTFGDNGVVHINPEEYDVNVSEMILDESERIVFSFRHNGRTSIGRLLPDGTPDSTFSEDGFAQLDTLPTGHWVGALYCLDVQSDGSIVAAGLAFIQGLNTYVIWVCRLNEDGEQDENFGSNGYFTINFENLHAWLNEMIVDDQDRIYYSVLFGEDESSFPSIPLTGRLLSDGTEDTSFNSPYGQITGESSETVWGMTLLNDGGILLSGGGYPGINFATGIKLTKLMENGEPDLSFGDGTGHAYFRNDLTAYQPAFKTREMADGRLIVISLNSEMFCMRFTAAGELDIAFGENGRMSTGITGALIWNGHIEMEIQQDEKIVVLSNHYFNETHTEDGLLFRFLADTSQSVLAPSQQSFALWPNPAHDFIRITEDRTLNSIDIIDATGRLVMSFSNLQEGSPLDISGLTSGVYAMNVLFKNNYREVRKLVKE